MEDITAEKANHIINYYSGLLTPNEKRALTQHMTSLKFADDKERLEKYYRMGRLVNTPEVLDLLSEGYNQFVLNCAKRILTETPEKVFFNNCPQCGKLARTPQAKQCRFCGFDWH
ncbi:hypothetical protein ACFGVR_13680 [Mucilaginibacter sp. AW1-3]